MFTFMRKKPHQPSTIFIDGLSGVTTDQMSVATVWQQRHTISTIGDILSKAINDPADPIDAGLVAYINAHALTMPQRKPLHAITFDAHDGISGNIWHHGEYYLPAIKGMPEQILEHCDISDNERESIMIQLHSMAATGNTIIAVATGLLRRDIKDLRHLKNNEKLSFVGFVSLQMTVSSEAKKLLTSTKAAIHLVTGQHPAATYAISQQLNLAAAPSDVFDARRLDVMNVSEILSTVASTKVFARATPERKEYIYDALKAGDRSVDRVSTLADLQKLLAN